MIEHTFNNELEILSKACDTEISCESFPEIICVETCGYEAYKDDCYYYELSSLMKDTINFWKLFNYKVTFEKEA